MNALILINQARSSMFTLHSQFRDFGDESTDKFVLAIEYIQTSDIILALYIILFVFIQYIYWKHKNLERQTIRRSLK